MNAAERYTKAPGGPGHARALQQREQANAKRAIHDAMSALWLSRGSRYKECTFANYEVTHGRVQDAVKHALWLYGDHMVAELAAGTNIALIGPPGTGKDHLLAALMRQAVATGHAVKWTSGARLFARLRDDIETGGLESKTVAEYSRPDVLCISDPVWDNQPLTRQQRLRLGEIVDERYNNRRATWISVNAASRVEAATNLGEALIDRLKDGAVMLACNWPTARKPRGQS